MMAPQGPAGRLVAAFGRPDEMAAMYAYENEYTVFVHADHGGIHEVFEAMDTVHLLDFLRGDPPGSSFTRFISQPGA